MGIEVRYVSLDRDRLHEELRSFEHRYGVPSERRHEPFMRARRHLPFLRLRYELEETPEWQEWDRLYHLCREPDPLNDPRSRRTRPRVQRVVPNAPGRVGRIHS